MHVKLTEVHFMHSEMNPMHTDSMTECVADDANQYEITRHGDTVYIRAPAWGKRVMLIPWAQVRGAAGDVVEEPAAKPEAAQAVAKR